VVSPTATAPTTIIVDSFAYRATTFASPAFALLKLIVFSVEFTF